jgi:carboxypeptidase Taq
MADRSLEALKTRLNTVSDLASAAGLMSWDLRTMMPPKGGSIRADRLATVGRIAHELFVSDETGELLEAVAELEQSLPFDSDDASLIRVARRDFDKARKLPGDLQAELIRASAIGYEAWSVSRETSNFGTFLPALTRQVELQRQVIDVYRDGLPAGGEDYDILLDDYEPSLSAAEIRTVFDEVKQATIPLVARVSERSDRVDNTVLHGSFPLDKQRELALELIRPFGFDDDSWRLDPTQHPFASAMATTDIRLTTRYIDSDLSSAMFGTMHECGHGLYERGVSPSLERTLLARGASMSWHESQSRMWENLVGRSRAFWSFAFQTLAQVFPDRFDGTGAEGLYRAVNKMQPSLIRVEADELTYNLHIILRFELEQDIFNRQVDLKDLPEAWNTKMRNYLGIDVPDDAHGVLQDVHWGAGSFGYFPTYALGNVVSLQLWDRITTEIPDLEVLFTRGEFGPLREWLATNVHVHGRKFLPKELLTRVLDTDAFDARPLLTYLTRKVDDLYGLA